MNSSAKNVGSFGEILAQNFLRSRGYRILDKNTHIGKKEIDLVAEIQGITVFAEIKTVSSFYKEAPEFALTAKQTKTLKKAISAYCAQKKINKKLVRLDLITVTLNPTFKTAKIKHYIDIL